VLVLDGSGVKIEPCWTKENGQLVEGCRVTVQMNVDPLMRVVPPAIINFVLKVISPVVYRLAKYVIKTCVRKPGTKLHQRMKERSAFYDKVGAKVSSFLAARLPEA
jgi:hypothetical protein